MTKVYSVKTDCLYDNEIYNKAYSYISEERRTAVDSYKTEDDKIRSLTVSVLLKYALIREGIDEREYNYAVNEYGKPFYKELPLQFSLSHSGNTAVCAVSDCAVGCDVEIIRKARLDIAKRFFSEAEYNALIEAPDNDRDISFYRMWTLKEAYMKYIGKGFSLPMKRFTINLGEPSTIKTENGSESPRLTEFRLYDSYAGAVCSQDEPELIETDIKIILA